MHQLSFSSELLDGLTGQTVIITGSARGIGAATAKLFNSCGANVIVVDLGSCKEAVESLIDTFDYPDKALYVPADVARWDDLVEVFKLTIQRFGKADIVVANAAVMESSPILDVLVDEEGSPMESSELTKVLDINLKGTINLLRLGLHYLSKNALSSSGFRGSVVCITSTSEYFGATGNAGYIASKHGVVGLIRASLPRAQNLQIKLNSIAPCFTPTHITAGFGKRVSQAGLETNTPGDVALAIASLSIDSTTNGVACLVWGKFKRELEFTRQALMPEWLGEDLLESMKSLGTLIESIGGFPLPQNADNKRWSKL